MEESMNPILPVEPKRVAHRKPSKAQRPEPSAEQIAERAYQLYLLRGGANGHDVDDWLVAEEELRRELSRGSAKAHS
jgi:hypothetical protein